MASIIDYEDILIAVFSYLADEDLVHASEACRKWHEEALQKALWHALVRARWNIPYKRDRFPLLSQKWYKNYKEFVLQQKLPQGTTLPMSDVLCSLQTAGVQVWCGVIGSDDTRLSVCHPIRQPSSVCAHVSGAVGRSHKPGNSIHHHSSNENGEVEEEEECSECVFPRRIKELASKRLLGGQTGAASLSSLLDASLQCFSNLNFVRAHTPQVPLYVALSDTGSDQSARTTLVSRLYHSVEEPEPEALLSPVAQMSASEEETHDHFNHSDRFNEDDHAEPVVESAIGNAFSVQHVQEDVFESTGAAFSIAQYPAAALHDPAEVEPCLMLKFVVQNVSHVHPHGILLTANDFFLRAKNGSVVESKLINGKPPIAIVNGVSLQTPADAVLLPIFGFAVVRLAFPVSSLTTPASSNADAPLEYEVDALERISSLCITLRSSLHPHVTLNTVEMFLDDADVWSGYQQINTRVLVRVERR
jgi:F-box-like